MQDSFRQRSQDFQLWKTDWCAAQGSTERPRPTKSCGGAIPTVAAIGFAAPATTPTLSEMMRPAEVGAMFTIARFEKRFSSTFRATAKSSESPAGEHGFQS